MSELNANRLAGSAVRVLPDRSSWTRGSSLIEFGTAPVRPLFGKARPVTGVTVSEVVLQVTPNLRNYCTQHLVRGGMLTKSKQIHQTASCLAVPMIAPLWIRIDQLK